MKSNSEIMLAHIAEEPGLIRGLLDSRKVFTADFCRLFLENSIRRVYFSGSGSPANACEVLSFFCSKLLGVEATCIVPTLFNNHMDFNIRDYRPEEIMLICPAESGRTRGTVEAAARAAALGIHTACCTYNMRGTLAGICEAAMNKPSGEEIALPSSKGHTVGIAIFLLCFIEAALASGRMSTEEYSGCINDLYAMTELMGKSAEASEEWFCEHQEDVMDSGKYWFIASGANTGTAREGALKFLECTRRPAFAYELEEFMHGPLAALGNSDMVFFLLPELGTERGRMLELAEFCTRITDRCVSIGYNSAAATGIPLMAKMTGNGLCSVLELLIPIQVLACRIAINLGHDLTRHSRNSAGKAMNLSIEE